MNDDQNKSLDEFERPSDRLVACLKALERGEDIDGIEWEEIELGED